MINKKAVAILGAILLLIIGTVGVLILQRSGDNNGTDITVEPSPAPDVVFDTPPPTDDLPIDPPFELPPPLPTDLPPSPVPGGSTVTASKLTEREVLSPVLFYQGNGIAYLNTQGQLFQADLDVSTGQPQVGHLQEVVIPQRAGVVRVLWPDAGNNFILERLEGDSLRFSVYVSDKGDYVDMPPQVISMSWMPGGDRILYVWLEADGKSTLNIANPDNTGWQTITELWEPDNAIHVSPDGRLVAFYETKNQMEPNKLNTVTIDGKIFKSVVKEGFNFGTLWSPSSRMLVFLKRSAENENRLWLVNVNSGEVRDLGILIDSLDKVVWSQDSKWLFVGGQSADSGSEQLHRIDTATGTRQSFNFNVPADVREPFMNLPGTGLFFRNAADSHRLYFVDVSRLGQ